MTPVRRYQSDQQEAAAVLCAIVLAAGGCVMAMVAHRAFAMLYRPKVLVGALPEEMRPEAAAWARSAKHRESLTGMLVVAEDMLEGGVLKAEMREGRRWLVRDESVPLPEIPSFTREEGAVALTLAGMIQDI